LSIKESEPVLAVVAVSLWGSISLLQPSRPPW